MAKIAVYEGYDGMYAVKSGKLVLVPQRKKGKKVAKRRVAAKRKVPAAFKRQQSKMKACVKTCKTKSGYRTCMKRCLRSKKK